MTQPPDSDRSDRADRLVWIDCEMTGLDLSRDALIEIAVVITDGDLAVVDDGIDLVIHADDAALEAMPEVVRRMHADSGLTEEVRVATLTLPEAEQQVLDYLQRFVEAGKAALCGNSIGVDRGFIARDMPRVNELLHYRMIDVSSIKELVRRWYPKAYYAKPEKGLSHRALADIMESITELRYYREVVFVPPPGPDTDQSRAAAHRVGPAPAG